MRKLARMSMNLAQGGLRIPEFTVGERMRKAREESGLSQEEMATEIGIARRSIGRYEAGTAVKKSVLLLYAMRTQVPVEWLETGAYAPVGPTGLEPMTSTVESLHFATVTSIGTRRSA